MPTAHATRSTQPDLARLRRRIARDLPFLDFVACRVRSLVFNDPGIRAGFRPHYSGGRVEILLERALTRIRLVHLRASQCLKPGAAVMLPRGCTARML